MTITIQRPVYVSDVARDNARGVTDGQEVARLACDLVERAREEIKRLEPYFAWRAISVSHELTLIREGYLVSVLVLFERPI